MFAHVASRQLRGRSANEACPARQNPRGVSANLARVRVRCSPPWTAQVQAAIAPRHARLLFHDPTVRPSFMRTSDDPSWLLYPNTIFEFHTPTPFAIDLRQPLSIQAREHLLLNNLDRAFAVITACNPRGQRHGDVDNTRLAGQLKARLSQRGLQVVRVDGVSPDGTHRESGVAVKLTREDATTLAIHYQQSAFFWFDGEHFWVVPALVHAEPISLPPL